MPCSCGNTSCPCGIPCSCSEESCKCPACEIALNRFCKICNKLLITEMQTDKETCSCFVGEPTDIINRDNLEDRTGNVPTPLGYISCGKLITITVNPLPILHIPHLINQRPISFLPPPQKDSGNISPLLVSDTDVATPISSENDSGSPPTERPQQLYQSSSVANCCASSCASSTCAQNKEISCKKAVPVLVLSSTDERQTAHLMQNMSLETEEGAAVQAVYRSFPTSMRFDNITNPNGTLSNPPLSVADYSDSSRKLCNSLCKAGSVHTMTACENECRKPASSLKFDSNNNVQGGSVTVTRINEQLFHSTRMTGQPGLYIHGKRKEYEDSLPTASQSEFTVFPSPGKSNAIASTEQSAYNYFGSNERSEVCMMHGGTLANVSTVISNSRMSEYSTEHLQPACAAATTRGHNDLQTAPAACSAAESISNDDLLWSITSFRCPQQSSSNTQALPGYLVDSKLQLLFNKSGNAQGSYSNENRQSSNRRSSENRRTVVNDPLPLYVDASTTQKMQKLLKSVNRSNAPFFR